MRFFCFILGLLFSIQALAFSPEELRTFGQKAPVQFYLFTSLTCSHCADFHKKILPILKKEYVDTGKAQLIIVDAIQNDVGLMATQVLRCVEND